MEKKLLSKLQVRIDKLKRAMQEKIIENAIECNTIAPIQILS